MATPRPAATYPRRVGRSSATKATLSFGAQSFGLPAKQRGRLDHDERLIGDLAQRDLVGAFEAVAGSDQQAQGLHGQDPPAWVLGARRGSQGRELDIHVAARIDVRHRLVGRRAQVEVNVRVLRVETAHQVWYEPAAERGLEGDGDRAPLRVQDLLHRRDPVIKVVQHRVDVLLERGPGVSQPQHPALTPEQWGPHVQLAPAQGTGDRRL